MPRKKTKTIRTLPDLCRALDSLVLGGCSSEAKKHTVDRQGATTRVTLTFYGGEMLIRNPPDNGPPIIIHETGDTPLDVFIACRDALRNEIEERARKRKLEQKEQKRISHKPKRLTYSP